MLKWIESTGKSEEAAIEAALQKLAWTGMRSPWRFWSGPSPDF